MQAATRKHFKCNWCLVTEVTKLKALVSPLNLPNLEECPVILFLKWLQTELIDGTGATVNVLGVSIAVRY